MSPASIPAVPGGLRAGQLGVIVIGRVIKGDVAVTVVDLAQRKMLTLAGTGDDDDWRLTPAAAPSSGRQQLQLLEYEERLLNGLSAVGAHVRLSALATGFGSALDATRKALVHEAVHQGWLPSSLSKYETNHDTASSRFSRSARIRPRAIKSLSADSDSNPELRGSSSHRVAV